MGRVGEGVLAGHRGDVSVHIIGARDPVHRTVTQRPLGSLAVGRPGMVDVARLAGVSHQTVSRVLNNSPAVHPETRRKVEHAIATLGYRRNLAARTLASRRSGAIGVIALETTLHGPASTLHGIERAAREAGFFVTITSCGADQHSVDEAFGRLAEQSVEGIVMIAPLAAHATPVAPDVPVVLTQAAPSNTVATVGVDQYRGAQLVTSHLLASGAATVWHVAGPAGWVESEQRVAGWHDALTAAGAHLPDPLRGDWSPASGYRVGRELAWRSDVEAVFVANDHMALGLLRALDEAGRRVPDDVVVAGFDDIPEAAFFAPPLTTVRQDFLAVGRRAIELLVGRLDGQPGTHAVVDPSLVVRASSSPATGAALDGRVTGERTPVRPR